MKKFLLVSAAALALFAGSAAVNTASAQSNLGGAEGTTSGTSGIAYGVAGGIASVWLYQLFIKPMMQPGAFSVAFVPTVEGAGYSTSLASRLNNSPELTAQMASWRKVEEYEALASAAR